MEEELHQEDVLEVLGWSGGSHDFAEYRALLQVWATGDGLPGIDRSCYILEYPENFN